MGLSMYIFEGMGFDYSGSNLGVPPNKVLLLRTPAFLGHGPADGQEPIWGGTLIIMLIVVTSDFEQTVVRVWNYPSVCRWAS